MANSESIGVKKTLEIINKANHIMNDENFKQHSFIIQRFERAKQLKEQRYKYYDGMTYEEDYITNENLKNTYITPKLNTTEVRVNTGTSEKKLDAIKNELLTMNLQHEVRAFDQSDMEIAQLGDDVGDIVTRTNQIEKDDDVYEEITDELLSQRLVYVRELFIEETIKRNQTKITMAKKELISGLKVFPGDWTIPAYKWDTQPYVVTYDRVGYERAMSILSQYENSKHIQPNKKDRNEYLGGAFTYAFGELQDGEVEIITYESLPDNEFQIYANGVPMLPPGSKLPQDYDKYSIRAYSLKSMSRNFLGGRPFTAMAKTMQAVSNETIRMLIRKFQQALEPPLATPRGGKIYAKGIWDPGAITQGVRKADFEKLTDHKGVEQGEFMMYRLIEEKTEEFIGTPNIAQGMQGSREMSATEVLTLQKQFIKQLGYTVAALMRMKRDLTEIRIYNILENYLTPTKRKYDDLTKSVQDVYRSFTIENASFSNNRKGKKIIKLFDRDLTAEEKESLMEYEDNEEKRGNPVRIKFINKEKLKSIPIFWYVIVTMQDKEGTTLDKVTFQDQLNQAAGIIKLTGKPLNPDVVTEDFERKWKAKDWFNVEAPKEQQQPGQSPEDVQKDSQNLLKDIEKMATESQGEIGPQVSRGLRGGEPSAQRSANMLEANV
uniref:Portal protein n=2 Tax=viral metagenome TaxID=1070528 RepID=A0A6M3XU76_9ZZZZ